MALNVLIRHFIKHFINTMNTHNFHIPIVKMFENQSFFHFFNKVNLIIGTLFALDYYSFTNFIDERISLWMIISHHE